MTEWSRVRNESQSLGTEPYWFYNRTGSLAHGLSPHEDPIVIHGYPSLGSVTKTTSDMVTPNFRSRIEAGEVINNPFLTTTVTETRSPPMPSLIRYSDSRVGQRIWCGEHGVYHDRVTEVIGNRVFWPSTWLDVPSTSGVRQAVIDLAVTQAHANIDTSEMLALATVAESRKTVESMAAILRRAYTIFKRVKRLQFVATSRELQKLALKKELSPKELSDRYMELRYAIRPLVYDAIGVAKAFQKARGYERKTFRGYAEDSVAATPVSVPDAAQPVRNTCLKTAEYNCSARAGVLCDVSITDLSVLGLDQLAETMWELTPFSFIADWFANTGDWIAAHTPNAGVTQRASWVTVKEVSTQTQTWTASWNLPVGMTGEILNLPSGVQKRETLCLERMVDPALSTFPSAKLRLDVFKLTDLGIILRKMF